MHTKHDMEKVVVQFDVQDTTEDELDPAALEGEDPQVRKRGTDTLHYLHTLYIYTHT